MGVDDVTYSGKHMARAAFLLMVTVILSRVLGYGREVALYTLFGQITLLMLTGQLFPFPT